MLVLSRHRDEEIIIGPLPDGSLITILVVDLRGDKARLGIDAPSHIPINRKEVFRNKHPDIPLPVPAV